MDGPSKTRLLDDNIWSQMGLMAIINHMKPKAYYEIVPGVAGASLGQWDYHRPFVDMIWIGTSTGDGGIWNNVVTNFAHYEADYRISDYEVPGNGNIRVCSVPAGTAGGDVHLYGIRGFVEGHERIDGMAGSSGPSLEGTNQAKLFPGAFEMPPPPSPKPDGD